MIRKFRHTARHSLIIFKHSPFLWAVLALSIFLAIWSLASLKDWKTNGWVLKGIATSLGVAGYFIFSLSLLLSSRWRKLEDWIGGLDQIYHLHRRLGILGFVLTLIHPWLEAIKWIPKHLDKFILFTLPVHGRLSINLGSLSYWMMIIIIVVTIFKLIPYNKWKNLHKFMSLVFILASLHILLSDKRFGTGYAHSLLLIPMTIGFWGVLYKNVFYYFIKQPILEVVKVEKINENVAEITLRALNSTVIFNPGQYGFFCFDGPLLTKESHPFTLIEIPDDPNKIIILVKSRGDYTKSLFQHIKIGYLARFEGPYGRFDYSFSGDSQIWIAGGIGIVPFLAWKRAINHHSNRERKIDLYYCVHKRKDAIFYDEFQQFSMSYPNFRCFLHCAEEGNRIDVKKILSTSKGIIHKKILMCGPMKLTDDLKKQFQEAGVKNEDIEFEDFEFF